jgi:hypothetical protein
LVAALFTATVSSSAAAQQSQQKQDTTKKAEQHDMSKMKEHDMSKMKEHDMSGIKEHDMSKMMEQMGRSWKEMNAFHQLLAATYHPASKDTLQPLRDRAAELAVAAKAWSGSTAPASCNSDEIKQKVATLATDAQGIAAQVQAKATDADLKTSIAALHALFESVEMTCGGHDMKGMKH